MIMNGFFNRLSVSRKLLSITFFFCFILISVISYTVITLQQQKADSTVIDIAGRQRMLIQKYTMEVLKELAIRQSMVAARQIASIVSNQVMVDRAYYTKSVAAKLQHNASGIEVTDKHHSQPNKIPLPATFVQDVSALVDERFGYKYRLLSRWNINPEKGLSTDFERRAWAALSADQDAPYSEAAPLREGAVLHYATADRALPDCVACHNKHPDSLKQDFKANELMGILVVTARITDDPDMAKIVLQGEIDPAADRTATLFETSHRSLRQGGDTYQDFAMSRPISIPANSEPEIESKLVEVVLRWTELRLAVDSIRIIEVNTKQYYLLLNHLTSLSSQILNEMNQAVGLLAQNSANKVRTMVYIEWAVLALALILGIFFALLVSRMITKPLKQVMKATSKVAEGDLDIESELSRIESGDEVGQLSEAFGDLASRLQRRTDEVDRQTQEIRELNSSLEQKVELRTNQFQLAKDEAEKALQVKSAFMAMMSHEIRTPMNGVLGMSELLQDTELDDEQHECLTILSQSAHALMVIINDILDFSKMEAGKLELEPISFGLEHLVYDACKLMVPNANEKGLELVIDYSPECYRRVVGDPGRMRQVILNLVSNAIKFTAEGHVVIEVGCLGITEQQMIVRFQVTDTGIGINPDAITDIFQSFTQADNSTTRRFGGTGLGLAICKQLVELMDGEIDVLSEEGKGSTFYFTVTLPLSPEKEVIAEESLVGVRTLILGTTEMSQKTLGSQLALLQMEVVSTFDSNEIPTMLESAVKTGEPYQLVIIDEQSLDNRVFDLANKIRSYETFSDLPLILLTSLTQQGAGKEADRVGYSAFLTKPVNFGSLQQALAQAMAQSRGENEHAPLITRHSLEESMLAKPLDCVIQNKKILLVEDVVVNQRVTTGMLKKLELDVDVANNGREAVTLFSQEEYDLVLMDCRMPEMDGYEATQLIREMEQKEGRHTPVIALTANAKGDASQRCYASGMDDFLSKPFTIEALQEKISCWLGASD